jgi:sialic acid synthase SpsE
VTRFIAEIGSNHNRQRERCLALVDAAAAAGCEAVKLQIFRVRDLFTAQALARDAELAAREQWEFPLELLEPVGERCAERGIELGATPFSPWAVEALAEHGDFFKVASYDLLRHDLIEMCAATGRPLILSTGMATLSEVDEAVAAAGDADLRLLHCVSGYPTPPEQANLAAIATLRERFAVPVGWSDHTCSERVVLRALRRWHASDVEIHIDLDGEGREAGAHSWTPRRVRSLIAASRGGPSSEHSDTNTPACDDHAAHEAEAALDGDGIKRAMPVEQADVPWRADPTDGLRPLRTLRAQLIGA